MGEEEKKPEEKKAEEAEKPAEEVKKEKKEEEKPPSDNKKEESKNEKDESAPAPPPPQEIILKVFMHCEGCARKVRRCLKGFEGVEDVITDCKSHKVVVKGEKADPLKVLDRVQRKSHRQVELLSPIPKTPSEEKSRGNEPPKPEEPKKEEPQIVTVVLRVHMHCEACAQEIKKRILRMKGVESAEADLKSSEVTVKGGFDPPKLVEYVYKRTGKHSVIAKQDPDNKKDKEEENKEAKEDKKGVKEVKEGGDGGDDAAKEINKEKKGGENGSGDGSASAEAITEEETKVAEFKNEYHYYPPRYGMEMYAYPYPPAPQIFSDENPNACSVM